MAFQGEQGPFGPSGPRGPPGLGIVGPKVSSMVSEDCLPCGFYIVFRKAIIFQCFFPCNTSLPCGINTAYSILKHIQLSFSKSFKCLSDLIYVTLYSMSPKNQCPTDISVGRYHYC